LDVRAYLLGVDQKRADISAKMNRMLEAGIEIHAQVVLCPEINDGEILKRTIRDLAALHPRIKSVAIVPLGLTRYNTDERLTPVTPTFCRRTISEVNLLQREFRETLGTTFAFLGDEIYLRGGVPIPSRKHYGDYPQIEDGIGMVRSFDNEFNALWRRLTRRVPLQRPALLDGTIMTGTLFAPVLKKQIDRLNTRFGTKLNVVGVENKYFGGDVSVAGLLTGECFLAAREQVRGNFVIIPGSSLKSGEAVMLDGMTLDEFKNELGLPVYPLDFASFARMISSGQ
jgi:putative radical SAM enzyme (TIGR03279 family)